MRLHGKMSCILQELRVCFDPAILTICTVPYNMKFDQHAMRMNEKVGAKYQRRNQADSAKKRAPRDVAGCGRSDGTLPSAASSDGIHFDTPKGTEWMIGVLKGT